MRNIQKKTNGHVRRFGLAALLITMTASIVFLCETSIHTYAIYVGDETTKVQSFKEDHQEVVEAAGFDTEDYELVKETTDKDGVTHLVLEKKFDVVIEADGKTQTVQTAPHTVGEILEEANVTLGELDEVQPSADTLLSEAQTIQVVRVTKETENQTVAIPFDTQTKDTQELEQGKTRVAQEGADGSKQQVIEVTYRDGVESGRAVTSETVVQAAKPKIVLRGTGQAVVSRGGDHLRYSQVLTVKATAYTAQNGSVTTATGTRCVDGGTIAVDPKVIPLGSRVYVTSADGTSWTYGTAVAADTGGKIKGNKIDLFFDTKAKCINFGVQTAKVYILE